MKKFLIFIISIPKYIGEGLVIFYKKCISPLIPHTCKFTPTCSTYMMESLKEWGFFKGFWLGMKRIFRCNPHSHGGVDPIKLNPKGEYKWLM